MPKFNVTVSFALRGEMEPDHVSFDSYGVDGVSDVEDSSYFYATEIECDGGSVTFVFEGESEDEARDAAESIVSEGNVVDDANGFGWEIGNVSVEVEEIEEPMTALRAKALIEEFIAKFEGMDEELKEAFNFLLDLLITARV